MICPVCKIHELLESQKDHHYLEYGEAGARITLEGLKLRTCQCGAVMPVIPHMSPLHQLVEQTLDQFPGGRNLRFRFESNAWFVSAIGDFEISVKKTGAMYEATVKGLPDLADYGDSEQEARNLALDSIATTIDVLNEKGRSL